MKQVIVIHGGTTFASYDTYLDYLSRKTVSIDRLLPKSSWKDSLQQALGEDYLVLTPSMPNSTNAKYGEWKLWFERITEIITDDCILIGHSLGGIFLAKYLSECEFPRRIKATILIAAPYDDESDEDLADFKLTGVSSLFQQQAGKILLFYGEDDPVVSASESEKYRQALPEANIHQQAAPDHFVRERFPELVRAIAGL